MPKPSEREPTIVVDMDQVLSQQADPPLQLVQVGGPGEGRSFRVLPLREATIGRDESCEISLDDKIISRRHTKVSYQRQSPEVLDLGSANGTFVNGQKVARSYLRDGDNLQVGTCSFQVEFGADPSEGSQDIRLSPEEMKRIRHTLETSKRKPSKVTRHNSVFSGQLREVNFMSLLQILGGNQSTGSLLIQYRYPSQKGTIEIERGELVHARLGPARGVKAFYRMASLEDGEFEFFSPGREPEDRTIDGGLEKHLLEAARHLDELDGYRGKLPSDDAIVSFKPRVGLDLSQVPPPVLEVMASIGKAKELKDVIDTCPLADLEVCRILAMLFQRGIVQRVDSSGQAKGQTAVLPKLKNEEN